MDIKPEHIVEVREGLGLSMGEMSYLLYADPHDYREWEHGSQLPPPRMAEYMNYMLRCVRYSKYNAFDTAAHVKSLLDSRKPVEALLFLLNNGGK